MKKLIDKLLPKIIKEYIDILKNEGFKALIKKGGYKLFLIIFIYYLIRDTILYVIPFLIAYYGFNNLF
tara:strand:+ start:572 stop:775 length:204 start_codon:yes stop_codon:yes gene_type:complete